MTDNCFVFVKESPTVLPARRCGNPNFFSHDNWNSRLVEGPTEGHDQRPSWGLS